MKTAIVATLPYPWRSSASVSVAQKILLDTDIGSDIDDAVALAYLLSEPRCELLGVTTVTGSVHQRSALVRHLLSAAGRSVPVISGYELPLVIEQRQKEAPQAAKLADLPADRSNDPEVAMEFLRDTILANKGEVTLLAVGPFTNVARLIEKDPEVLSHLRELVIMGGKYSDYPTPWGPTEWNAIVDPHATDQLFRDVNCPIRAFGLDITWQLGMTPEQVASRFSGYPLLDIVLDWSEVWFAERDMLHFHDPLAALAVFYPEVCGYAAGKVTVDLSPGPRQGVTHFEKSAGSKTRVATSVNADLFFQQFFGVFQPP